VGISGLGVAGFVLLQWAAIVIAARLGGALAVRCGQARVVGEVLTGLALGPSLLGALAPEFWQTLFAAAPLGDQAGEVRRVMKLIAQFGLVLLMFQIGLAFEFRLLAAPRERRAVAWVTTLGLAIPFALGLGLGFWTQPLLAPDVQALGYVLFMAVAMSITAVPVLGRMLFELGLAQRPLGVVTMASAALNDVVGWFALAIVSALAVSAFSPGGMLLKLAAFLAWAAFCWIVIRPWLAGRTAQALGAHGGTLPAATILLLAALALGSALVTWGIGLFAIFGGFLIGVLVHDQPGLAAAWQRQIGDRVSTYLLPVFFALNGLHTTVGSLGGAEWGWCAGMIAVATVGKFVSGFLAARIAGFPAREARCIGIMMNTRGLMELIVLNLGRELGVIPPAVFTMLVLMAVFTTAATMPLMRRWLPREQGSAPMEEVRT